MDQARARGRRAVCGWEANGGFLTGSDITRNGKTLRALPTRDAMLPILAVLFSAAEQKLSLSDLFDKLPRRYSRAALVKNFPRATSLKILQRFSLPDPCACDVSFSGDSVTITDATGAACGTADIRSSASSIREQLAPFFKAGLGFGPITRLNYTDGLRIGFENGDVAHVRPSGNADELRIYAVADSQARADAIAAEGVREPDGLLRRLSRGSG
jgi:phosphomannomutase